MIGENPERLIGMAATEAYRELLLWQLELESATLFEYGAPPKMQERISLGTLEAELVERSNRMRSGTGIPFWEALLATCSIEEGWSGAVLDAALFHNGQGVPRSVSRRDIEFGILNAAVGISSVIVALGSKLSMSGGAVRHLAFLDLHCGVSPSNQAIAHELSRRLMPQGFVLLDSGRSYHVCGVHPVSAEDRIKVLANAILLSPIVDARYIAHQLMQDSSSLRISGKGDLGKAPVVIDVWIPGREQSLRRQL